jgi:hypothetical protein
MTCHTTGADWKTFILGVGCQKGGSSWLHGFLRTLPGADLGFLKEYHIWDALHVSHCAIFRQMTFNWQSPVDDTPTWPPLADEKQVRLLRSFYEDVANYFSYFSTLLAHSDLTGDMTPAYALLPSSVYRQIREGFAARGVTVKVIFLLRDPVERICSHVRASRNHAVDANEDLLTRYRRLDVQARTHYEATLRNLEEVFPPDLVHCELYERLFTEQAVRRLCEFLGVPCVAADFTTRVNASNETVAFDERAKQEVAAFYRETYRDAAVRFGPSEILAMWPRSRDVIEPGND